jgi:excisionase family DNA binding protein
MGTLEKRPVVDAPHKFAVSRREAAALLDISMSTFDEWVRRGRMPKGVKVGALRRWDTGEVRTCWHALQESALELEEDDADGENPFDRAIG